MVSPQPYLERWGLGATGCLSVRKIRKRQPGGFHRQLQYAQLDGKLV